MNGNTTLTLICHLQGRPVRQSCHLGGGPRRL